MKLKTVLVSTALALSATLAAAGPVEYTHSWSPLDTGPFEASYSFLVNSNADFDGTLTTTSSVAGNVAITSLLLSNGSTQYLFDTLGDGFDFASVSTQTLSSTIKGHSIYSYTGTYAWDPVLLSAGEWTATIIGSNASDKQGGSLTLDLVDPPADVPEPASLALAVAALAALGFAHRRGHRG